MDKTEYLGKVLIMVKESLSLPRRAQMLCGNCQVRYWKYLARKEHIITNAKCPNCEMYAAGKVWDAPLPTMDKSTAIVFSSHATTLECPIEPDSEMPFARCQTCNNFVDSIGYEVYCRLKLDKIFSSKDVNNE